MKLLLGTPGDCWDLNIDRKRSREYAVEGTDGKAYEVGIVCKGYVSSSRSVVNLPSSGGTELEKESEQPPNPYLPQSSP